MSFMNWSMRSALRAPGVREEGLITAFRIKLQSPATLWVRDSFAPWLHCTIWQYKTALKSEK